MNDKKDYVVIIGAGPAGLTAGYELLTRSNYKPIIIEKSSDIGGISKTVNYKGNRIDIGGHRFFSKSDTVMNWWKKILPIQEMNNANKEIEISYQGKSKDLIMPTVGPNPDHEDQVMLIRERKSRILFQRQFYEYPLKLNYKLLKNLGFKKLFRIGYTYLKIKVFPLKQIDNLEQFFISRFGEELYRIFFKDYTEKVWGVPCDQIDSSWGAQRIKKLSITRTIRHAILEKLRSTKTIDQKNTDTSLIERFLYPKYGPGQMWETVADQIHKMGGEFIMESEVVKIHLSDNKVQNIQYKQKNGAHKEIQASNLISTMPVRQLFSSFTGQKVPKDVMEISQGLEYRDFITVGILVSELVVKSRDSKLLISDNWIYIQDGDVKLGRLQIFNNWSPYMIKDKNTVWLGLEYFCNKGDALWDKSDEELKNLGMKELVKLGLIEEEKVLDGTVIRMEKTYPVYRGAYKEFDKLRSFLDPISNLFLIGRNGMHKYNNQDHSMLTAIQAVDNIIHNVTFKENIWEINTEMEYHEKK